MNNRAKLRGRPRKMVTKSILVATAVSVQVKAELDEMAQNDDSSIARIVRQAVMEYLERRRAAVAA